MFCLSPIRLLSLPLTLAVSASIHAQTVPLSGNYAVDGVFMQGPARDQDELSAHVNECGDEVTLYHPQLRDELLLRFDDGTYSGQAEARNGTVEVALTAVDERTLEGAFTITPLNRFNVSTPAKWQLVLKWQGASKGDPPVSNYGRIVLLDSDVIDRRGVFVKAIETYRLELTRFPLRSKELLPQHKALLDSALETMMRPEPAAGEYCQTVQAQWLGPARGFADRRMERSNREALAAGRARSLSDYMNGRFVSGNVGGGPDYRAGDNANAPGRTCPRAAVVEFEVTREFADMYTRADVDEWYKDWLEAPQLENENESVFDGVFQDTRDNSVTRTKAKGAYCMARGFIRMLEDGYCELPQHSAAERALRGRRMSSSGVWREDYGTVQDEVKKAFGEFNERSQEIAMREGTTVSLSGSNPEAEEAEEARRQIPWVRYASTCPKEVRADADRIELDYYGDVVPWDRVFDFVPFRQE